MKLYLMRHGETDWNKLDKIQGKVDIELNEVGKEQARNAIEEIKKLNISRIICSPLTRAKQTAAIINEELKVNISYDKLIQERNFGILEGYRKKDFPWAQIWEYKTNIQYPEAEDIHTFYKRVEKFVENIKEEGREEENILVVAHGGVCIPLIAYTKEGGIELDDPLKYIPNNCQIVKLL
ncbi:MAG: histidine phosphatase family protein [Erysipelotrichaceae bacterium]